MKKLVGLVLLVAVGLIGLFWWRNLRGAMPALSKPARDIVEMFEQRARFGDLTRESGEGELAPGVNSTDFPLKLADGFEIAIFAQGLGNPRVLALDPNGVLVVSLTSGGRVVALPDIDGDGEADRTVELASNLSRPHGLAFRCEELCQLFVAEADGVSVYDYDENSLRLSNRKELIDLPSGGRHFTKTILVDDDKLLISSGSSCDTCVEGDFRRAVVLSANLDGSDLRAYSTGLRNAVFMRMRPGTDDVWVTEMGRDFLGDDLPPDEINILTEGKNYGWPYCYGKQAHDNVFDRSGSKTSFCATTEPSHIDLQAHSAPLGLEFVTENSGWPRQYWGDLLVAYHGSWNRSEPTGYKIVRFELDEQGNEVGREDFVAGWLDSGSSLGRPADVVLSGEGDLFVSDDKAGVIYRVFVTE